MAIRKGRELNNVNETWQRNEQLRKSGGGDDKMPAASTISNDLQQTIHEEATEYDNANKEDRLLEGNRASVNDDHNGDDNDS